MSAGTNLCNEPVIILGIAILRGIGVALHDFTTVIPGSYTL